jgi:hypothetical protein
VQVFYVRRAAKAGVMGAKTGAVTAVQRTSSDMGLNPYLHTIALDGTWSEQGNELVFASLGHLKTSEVGDVLEHAVRRIERHLDRRGLLGTRNMVRPPGPVSRLLARPRRVSESRRMTTSFLASTMRFARSRHRRARRM